jgi:hypothetical protein
MTKKTMIGRCFFFLLLLAAAAWAETRTYRAPIGQFRCHLELVTAKAFRAQTADYMWPSMSGPKLNLVLHLAGPQASFEEELEFAFGENLIPESRTAHRARGKGFRAAFIAKPEGRIFVAARTRSIPPLSDSQLQRVVADIERTLKP